MPMMGANFFRSSPGGQASNHTAGAALTGKAAISAGVSVLVRRHMLSAKVHANPAEPSGDQASSRVTCSLLVGVTRALPNKSRASANKGT